MNTRLAVLISLVALAATAQTAEPVPPAAIWGLEFSSDGKWLAAATNSRGHGGPILVWRVEDWKPHITRVEPGGGLDVAFSPDGSLLAYSTRGPQVTLIDVASGELVRTIRALDTEEGTVMSVAFTPDGQSLLTAGVDHAIHQWNLADDSLQRTLEGHSDRVNGIAVSPDGSLLISGSDDYESRLWDMGSAEVIQVFTGEDHIVRRTQFSPDGRFFLTSKYDGKTRIRDSRTRQLRAVLSHASSSAAITRDNRLVATASHDTTANVFRIQLDPANAQQTQRIVTLIERLDDEDYSIRERAGEEIVEIGLIAEPLLREALDATSAEVRIRARRLRQQAMSPEPIAKLGGHRGDVEVVCFSPDDRLLATGCRGGDVKIFSVPEFRELITLTSDVARP